MTDRRIEPPHAGAEAEVLLGFLDFQRETLRLKTEGLDAAQLDTALAPSTMTLGGMLTHLAYVEHWWSREVFLGAEPLEPWASADWKADEDWDWHCATGRDLPELMELWDAETARSRVVLADALGAPQGLDALARRPSRRHPDQPFTLRWIVLHLIEEYARHNGHADLIRESIDGSRGE